MIPRGRWRIPNTATLYFQFGTLTADLTRRNMELFAREVMPALKALN